MAGLNVCNILLADGSNLLQADGASVFMIADQTGCGGVVTPSGGWRTPPGLDRHETAEMRRVERERLGIEPGQQRAIDRAAIKIAAWYPQIGLLGSPQVIAAPAFDRLLGIIQPTEGQVMALAQAILDRIAWVTAQQDEEEQMVVRMMMEMD